MYASVSHFTFGLQSNRVRVFFSSSFVIMQNVVVAAVVFKYTVYIVIAIVFTLDHGLFVSLLFGAFVFLSLL